MDSRDDRYGSADAGEDKLVKAATRPLQPVTPADLARFTDRFADLADERVMRGAWS